MKKLNALTFDDKEIDAAATLLKAFATICKHCGCSECPLDVCCTNTCLKNELENLMADGVHIDLDGEDD